MRRTKAQVLTHLPPMAEVIVPVSMSALQKKLYKSILSKDVSLIKSIMSRGSTLKKTDRAKLNNLLMQLRKCVCHPFLYNSDIEEITTDDNKVIHSNLVEAGSKLGLLNIMLPKLQQRGHRVLMFSQFLGMLDIIEDFLNGLGLKFHRLDGDVSTMDRQKRIDEFNAPDSDYFAFLLSTRAGGVGINLATADTVILLDPDFNPHQDIQALSRAHRIGQKNKVLVFHLMTRDTAEERIMQIGKKKLLLDHLIIERMGVGVQGEEEDSIDVESVLSFGARRLFEDDDEDRIKYDDESVDKLLDRSLIEQTKTTNENGDKSAENAFSFARVWANDKTSLEENVGGDESDGGTPEPGFWDKILREREEEARREIEANREELGRGRRRKTAIYTKYAVDDEGKDNDSDTDFQAPAEHESESEFEHELNMPIVDDLMEVDHNGVKHRGVMAELPRRTTNGHPDAPTAQPGMIPYQELRRVELIAPTDNPAFSKCKACKHRHAPGTCTLKKAGVENCPLCGIAHLPKATICPHMSSETQLTSMLNALRESNEDRDIVDAAKRYVRRRKKQVQHEKRESEIRAEKEAAAFAP